MKKFGIEIPKKSKLIIVLCSKWCKSCNLLSKILEKFKNEVDFNLKEIDISENTELARKMNIFAVPALIFFKDGKLLDKNITINGEIVVNHGVMIGSFNELILEQVLKQI